MLSNKSLYCLKYKSFYGTHLAKIKENFLLKFISKKIKHDTNDYFLSFKLTKGVVFFWAIQKLLLDTEFSKNKKRFSK